VWWIDLAPLPDPGSVLDEVARILGVTAAGMELGDAVVWALSRRKALLLIDNCEHVAAAVAETVERLLGGTTGPQVLATSRTPLGIEHERRWPVPPLSLPPETEAVELLDESDAVQLFVERARAVRPSFVLNADNALAVAEACKRLDGVSLSVEIAAAQLSEQTPQEMVRRLDERFALLELPTVEGLTRHTSLEAALDASYVLLSEQERTVFDRLSTFVGPFELDAAAAVGSGGSEASSWALADVLTLARASLLTAERDGVEKRYRLLETLREYGIAHVRTRDAEAEARRAHADYHLGLAEQAGAALGTPEFAPWVDRLTLCYAEVRQALAWSLEHQERAVSLRATPALRELWYRQGWAREAGRWAARMLKGDLEGVPPALLAEAHNAAGLGADLAMDFSAAVSHLEEAVRRAREAVYLPGLVFGLWGRAAAAFALGDVGSMRRSALEGLRACEQADDRWGRAGPLAILGNASLFAEGELTEARAWLEQALPLYRELADVGGLVVLTLTPLSEIARRQQDLKAAELFATESLEVARGTAWEATALVQYAIVLGELGDVEAAKAAALRGLRLALETGLEQWFRLGLRELSRTFARGATWEVATTLLAASRRGIPGLLVDLAVLGLLEKACREKLGDDRFEKLTARGEAMGHEELMDLVGAADL
jgi:predicted ATPase